MRFPVPSRSPVIYGSMPLHKIISQIKNLVASVLLFTCSLINQGNQLFFTNLLVL
ncbi:hypothetical protein EP10_002812 [Geobacillus icigianus]|uniref:Uncharacterized protein n=1 Tax=Geobacillus icigianus TaxID=1430331 RepID=A0ABU6BIU4_9BACL|nr:hypothetical protein [Geobacillus icigianus]